MLIDLDALLPTVTWAPMPNPPPEITAFRGTGGPWIFIVAGNATVADGTATCVTEGIIVRFTREQARRAFNSATEQKP